MKRRTPLTFAAAASCGLAWALGCNSLSGVDDLVPVIYSDGGGDVPIADTNAPPVDDADAGSDARVHDFDAGLGDGGSPIVDAGVVDANAGLCLGLTMMLRFDGTTTSSQGDTPTSSLPTAPGFIPGKFGQALNATGTTQIDYSAKSGAVASSSQGTVSMWVDSQWELPCNEQHTFFGVDDNGVYMDCEKPGYLGLYVDYSPNSGVGATIDPATGGSVWNNGYNHIVATWSTSPPALSVTLNGAVGQTTNYPWDPPDPVAAIFHLAASGASPNASIDDVAVWTRPLSPAEIHTIFLAGASVGDVCKLK